MKALANFAELVGTTIVSVEGCEKDSETIRFLLDDGRVARLYHDQDCCEHVAVEDVAGDPADLCGTPIVLAEESTSNEFEGRKSDPDECDSCTWTFYRIGTVRGTVVIRWLGSSNGYYAEDVDFDCTETKDPPPLRPVTTLRATTREFDLG